MATSFTVIENGQSVELPAEIVDGSVRISTGDVSTGLGWELKERGLCRGGACIPVEDTARFMVDGAIDLEGLAEVLGQPLAIDVDEHAAALGTPVAERTALLESREAPDFTLPDLDGKPQSLWAYRGRKVLLIAHASW